jgi:hypothetical protein
MPPDSYPFHADGGHFGYDLLVTQDTRAACPPSHGTLSAMEMESLSAISGMRTSITNTKASAVQRLSFNSTWHGRVVICVPAAQQG